MKFELTGKNIKQHFEKFPELKKELKEYESDAYDWRFHWIGTEIMDLYDEIITLVLKVQALERVEKNFDKVVS